jgi:hypothetical protein
MGIFGMTSPRGRFRWVWSGAFAWALFGMLCLGCKTNASKPKEGPSVSAHAKADGKGRGDGDETGRSDVGPTESADAEKTASAKPEAAETEEPGMPKAKGGLCLSGRTGIGASAAAVQTAWAPQKDTGMRGSRARGGHHEVA